MDNGFDGGGGQGDMGSIGSFIVRGPPARAGETVREAFPANHLRDEGRPLGGKLYLTTERVVFAPHLLDAWLGGAAWSVDLEAILVVATTPGEASSAPDRLRLDTEEGTETFIVHDHEGARTAIDDAAADAIRGSAP